MSFAAFGAFVALTLSPPCASRGVPKCFVSASLAPVERRPLHAPSIHRALGSSTALRHTSSGASRLTKHSGRHKADVRTGSRPAPVKRATAFRRDALVAPKRIVPGPAGALGTGALGIGDPDTLYSVRARRRIKMYLKLRLLELRKLQLQRAAAVLEHRLPVAALVSGP